MVVVLVMMRIPSVTAIEVMVRTPSGTYCTRGGRISADFGLMFE